jgi:hypothetical protein
MRDILSDIAVWLLNNPDKCGNVEEKRGAILIYF